MNPFLQKMDGITVDTSSHAHLLVAESDKPVARESPEAVMAEVEFRTTHIGSLLEKMFEEAMEHDCFQPWDKA